MIHDDIQSPISYFCYTKFIQIYIYIYIYIYILYKLFYITYNDILIYVYLNYNN